MTTLNATAFRKELFTLLSQTIKFSEPVTVCTKDGNAVVISEEDYSGLMETVYLMSIPGMEKKLLDGINEDVSDCIPEGEVQW